MEEGKVYRVTSYALEKGIYSAMNRPIVRDHGYLWVCMDWATDRGLFKSLATGDLETWFDRELEEVT